MPLWVWLQDALAAEADSPFVDEDLYNRTKEEAMKAALKAGKKPGAKGKAGEAEGKRRPSLSSGLQGPGGRRRSIAAKGRG
jgi:hypothetical protein